MSKRTSYIRTMRGCLGHFVRWTWRWGGRLTLVLLVVGLAYVAWANHQGTRAVRQFDAALRDRNVPTTIERWRERHFGTLDAERDGTRWYRAAMVASDVPEGRTRHLPTIGDAARPEPTHPIDPDTAADLAAFMDEHRAVFDLIEQARAYEQFDFGFVHPDLPALMRIGLLGDARRLARWLEVRNLHAQASDDGELAVQSVLAGWHLNDALSREPTGVADMVRMSIDMLLVGMVEDMLGRMVLDDEALGSMRAAIERRRDREDLPRVLESDLALALMSASDRERLIYGTMVTRRALRDLPRTFPEAFPLADWLADMRRAGGRRQLDGVYRIWLALCPGRLEQAAMTEAEQSLAFHDALIHSGNDVAALARQRAERDTAGDYASPDAILGPTMRRRGYFATAKVGLSVERFRLAHDRWPDDLAEVESALGAELPTDPYTDNPLHYRKTGTGVIIYSVGDNLTDDGGHARNADPDGRVSRDIVFRLYDVERRNHSD